MNKITFRNIEREDLDDVFRLLQQLTEIDYSDMDLDECWTYFKSDSNNGTVGIYEDKIVAYGSIVIEHKIRGEKAGHIEDIVVDESVRGLNFGVKLIEELIKVAKYYNCYRVTLLCDESLSKFYEKNNLTQNGIAMKLRL